MSEFLTPVNGVLWMQGTDGAIASYDTGVASTTETFSMRVVLSQFSPGGAPTAGGRVRGVSVNGKVLGTHALRTKVYADDRQRLVSNKTRSITLTTPSKSPGIAPECRLTQQRCMYVKIELIATPAKAEWTSIDVWASGTDERFPSTRRS